VNRVAEIISGRNMAQQNIEVPFLKETKNLEIFQIYYSLKKKGRRGLE